MERTIQQIAAKFHISEEWLRDGEGEMLEPEAPARTEDEIKFLNAYRTLTPEMQLFVSNRVDELLAMQEGPWQPRPAPKIVEEPVEYKKKEEPVAQASEKITLQ